MIVYGNNCVSNANQHLNSSAENQSVDKSSEKIQQIATEFKTRTNIYFERNVNSSDLDFVLESALASPILENLTMKFNGFSFKDYEKIACFLKTSKLSQLEVVDLVFGNRNVLTEELGNKLVDDIRKLFVEAIKSNFHITKLNIDNLAFREVVEVTTRNKRIGGYNKWRRELNLQDLCYLTLKRDKKVNTIPEGVSITSGVHEAIKKMPYFDLKKSPIDSLNEYFKIQPELDAEVEEEIANEFLEIEAIEYRRAANAHQH